MRLLLSPVGARGLGLLHARDGGARSARRGCLEREAAGASPEPRAGPKHEGFAGESTSGRSCVLRKQVTHDLRRSHGRRGGRHRATLRHWLDQYEDPELMERMEFVLGNSRLRREAVQNLEKMLPGADVKRLVSKYPLLLGMDKSTVATRMVKLAILIPGGDICKMVEMQPMMLLVPDVEGLAEEAVDDIAGHLEVDGALIWDMVGRHPSLLFQDLGDRRRAAMEYMLLDGNAPVGKDLSAVRPPRPTGGGYVAPESYTRDF